ncbi:ComF family protein [Cohnella algarum]|uniref:ComF family protein n=1 Tax=Cohnella algarum TaxID=2044859 RepID=UPI0019670953|nr:phosphoribosyltransferase family protein [Cohnella algarum]MBN2980076.1 hypothetical protein [Cohnella algarum]
MLGKLIGGAIGTIFGPAGTAAGVAVGHALDALNGKRKERTLTPSPPEDIEKLIRGPYFAKGEAFALSLYFPLTADRELHHNDTLTKAIIEMKYHYRHANAALFAGAVQWFILKTGIRREIDGIVTCPASQIRATQPLELIAEKVSQSLSIPYFKVLEKNGQASKTSGSGERKASAGSIRLTDSSAIVNKRILLLDDIITTGYTMSASKKRLLEGGAADVLALAILSTAGEHPPQLLELGAITAESAGMPLTQRVKAGAVEQFYLFDNGKLRKAYAPEYGEYVKQKAKEAEARAEKRKQEEAERKAEEKLETQRRAERELDRQSRLATAVRTGDEQSFRRLMGEGTRLADFEPLIQALMAKHDRIVKDYINACPESLTNEVLFAALESDFPGEMLENKVKAFHSNKRREAIIQAVREGRSKAVRKMAGMGFNLNVRDPMGDSLLDIARKKGYAEIVEILKSKK